MILEILYTILGFLILIFLLIIVVFMPISTIPVVFSDRGLFRGLLRVFVIPALVSIAVYAFIYIFLRDNITTANCLKYYAFVPGAFFFTLFITTEKYF